MLAEQICAAEFECVERVSLEDSETITLGGAAMNSEIDVGELGVTQVEHVEALAHGDRIVLLIDGRAHSVSRDVATELAFRICERVEAMRRGSTGASDSNV